MCLLKVTSHAFMNSEKCEHYKGLKKKRPLVGDGKNLLSQFSSLCAIFMCYTCRCRASTKQNFENAIHTGVSVEFMALLLLIMPMKLFTPPKNLTNSHYILAVSYFIINLYSCAST